MYYDPTTRSEPDQAEFKKHVESQIADLRDSTEIAMFIVGGALAIGGWLCASGFLRWSKIQPLHDELLELQVAKARREVNGNLDYRDLSPRPEPNGKRPHSKKSKA